MGVRPPTEATTRTGDGNAQWSASAYVGPLVESPPTPPLRGELGVLTHRWQHRDLRRLSEALCRTADGEGASGVHALALVNPGLGATTRTTRTLTGAVTYLTPGAGAKPLRRLAGARVVLEGRALFTPSGGTPVTLSPGDIVLSDDLAAGEWRADDLDVLWFDGLDLPLVSAIAPPAFRARPRRADPPLSRLHRWTETETALASPVTAGVCRIAPVDAPGVGGDAAATLGVEVHRLDPGPRPPSVRGSQSAIVVVLGGAGASVVAGWRFRWQRGDVFVVPPAAPVDHQADVTADLLVVSDAAALHAMGLWWSETAPDPQPIENTLE